MATTDLWHIGELPGDDGRQVRDQSGLLVIEAYDRAQAKRFVRDHNDEGRYPVTDPATGDGRRLPLRR